MSFENIFSKKQERKERTEEKIKIITDKREKNSLVISELINQGVDVEIKYLPVADFLVNGIAVERKTVSDFLNSMINKRLIRQLEEMKQYPRQLLIIEGLEEQELYNDESDSGINANAIRGFLLSILLSFQVPIIFSKDYEDTARFLIILAKKQKKEHSLNAKKKSLNKKEQLQYIVEGFPGIGPKKAKKLLTEFKTIKNIINSDKEILKKFLGKQAESLFSLINDEY